MTSTNRRVPASTPETTEISVISGKKTAQKHPFAVISPLKAPQATRDLGMVRVDRSAVWLPGEHAKSRSATARSVSTCTPRFRSWSDPPFLSFPRPASVPVEYRGPNAWHVEFRCSIATTTRHILTLQPENQRSFCPRSLELTEDKNAHRRDLDFPLGAQVPALTVRATLPMNDHRFRGSHHDTTLIDHAMYACDERVVIEIQSAAGSASMYK